MVGVVPSPAGWWTCWPGPFGSTPAATTTGALAVHHSALVAPGRADEPDQRLLAELIRGWSGTPVMVATAC